MRDFSAMAGRCLKRALRNPDTYITSIVLPVMIYLMFTAVFAGAIDPTGGYPIYMLPGVALTVIGFCASSTGSALFLDASGGFIDRFRSLPVRRHALLAGHAAASLLRNALAVGCVFLVALLLGNAPSPTLAGLFVAILLMALYALLITAISAVFGLIASSAEGAGAFSMTVLFLPYLSSGFVPTAAMARPLRAFAYWQPLTPISDALRASLTGQPIPRLPEAFAWTIGLSLIFALLAARLIGRERAE